MLRIGDDKRSALTHWWQLVCRGHNCIFAMKPVPRRVDVVPAAKTHLSRFHGVVFEHQRAEGE
eukprot:6708487-Lingulodinium_polyedra.AAC.1